MSTTRSATPRPRRAAPRKAASDGAAEVTSATSTPSSGNGGTTPPLPFGSPQELAAWGLGASTAYLHGVQAVFDLWKQQADGWVQFNEAAWTAAAGWFEGLSKQGPGAELLEAEVEHVVSPLAASPLAWPAQEAARQAMTMAASAWNDWLGWSAEWAQQPPGLPGMSPRA